MQPPAATFGSDLVTPALGGALQLFGDAQLSFSTKQV